MAIESLVVPATGVTMFLSSPSNAFVSEDLPTFGLPTIAICGIAGLSSSCSGSSGSSSRTLSSKSPVPAPLADEMANGSPRPNELNTWVSNILSPVSTLLATIIIGFLLLRRILAIISSKSVIPVPTSQRKRTTSASSIAR